MAGGKVVCDTCTKKVCDERMKGAVCYVNEEVKSLADAAHTRDPISISRFIIPILDSEMDRYKRAKAAEEVGVEVEKTIRHADGREYTVTETRTIDNNISNLAMNLVKAGKIINDMLNPVKAVPFNQTNIQNNYGVTAADVIRSMDEKERENVLKYIDEKLDNRQEV